MKSVSPRVRIEALRGTPERLARVKNPGQTPEMMPSQLAEELHAAVRLEQMSKTDAETLPKPRQP
jgi:hypothetical protein